MGYATGIQLGAPGVYRAAVVTAPRFEPVRLDITGFAGVAPRGPVNEPVTVESWTQYRWRFGGAGPPGRLGLAVQSFFAQGGERAVVLRVGPPSDHAAPADPTVARARLRLAPGVELVARDEGAWGDNLSVQLRFDVSAHHVGTSITDGRDLLLPASVTLAVGSLLRIRAAGLPAAGAFRWVENVVPRDVDSVRRPVTVVGEPLPRPGQPVELDVVTGTVTVTDGATDLPREEVFAGLGLRDAHPAWLGRRLDNESLLVRTAPGFPVIVAPPDVLLTALTSAVVTRGEDRYARIGPDSFFGDLDVELMPTGGEPVEEDRPFVGVDRLALDQTIGLLCVPDLLWGEAVPAEPTIVEFPAERAGPRFGPCPQPPMRVEHQPPPPDVALLDGGTQLAEILRRQHRVVDLAEHQRRFVALLDVPMRMSLRQVARWRGELDASYAAAYHPWLGVAPTDATDLATLPTGTGFRLMPPSAAAAGIIAQRERTLGLPWGPANATAVDVLTLADPVTDADADALHLMDVNAFRPRTDGFQLISAHTLARDPQYRQLTVRRLMTMLRLVLDRQAQWLAFEPNDDRLRALLRSGLVQLLRDLYRAGAFQGATEEEAFFVRCDDALNPAYSQGLGRLVAEIGVAPSSPLEYLVLRIARRTDSGLTVEG
jgi:hypothetical protein